MTKIINGTKIADQILSELKKEITKLPGASKPSLAVILIGDNPASHLYVSLKEKRAAEVGINFQKYLFPSSTSQEKIISLIKKLNADPKINALIVQLPLPKKFSTAKIISAINPNKDADGLHPQNLKLLALNKHTPVLPATAGAVAEILKSLKTNLVQKSAAIIGKGPVAGLPIYYYLKNNCHQAFIYDRRTKNLPAQTKKADLLVVAIGQPYFIDEKYIKPGARVIDVGITKVKNKTLGDVNFHQVKNLCSAITPVPGGVGPLTVAVLLKNTLTLFKSSTTNKNHQI
jgi:methylenetetrahydrofolate dehydrogenase (NADP+) / methenyltetrahydrofolate cyclohydrolase